jgi:hypothetical protein
MVPMVIPPGLESFTSMVLPDPHVLTAENNRLCPTTPAFVLTEIPVASEFALEEIILIALAVI